MGRLSGRFGAPVPSSIDTAAGSFPSRMTVRPSVTPESVTVSVSPHTTATPWRSWPVAGIDSGSPTMSRTLSSATGICAVRPGFSSISPASTSRSGRTSNAFEISSIWAWNSGSTSDVRSTLTGPSGSFAATPSSRISPPLRAVAKVSAIPRTRPPTTQSTAHPGTDARSPGRPRLRSTTALPSPRSPREIFAGMIRTAPMITAQITAHNSRDSSPTVNTVPKPTSVVALSLTRYTSHTASTPAPAPAASTEANRISPARPSTRRS